MGDSLGHRSKQDIDLEYTQTCGVLGKQIHITRIIKSELENLECRKVILERDHKAVQNEIIKLYEKQDKLQQEKTQLEHHERNLSADAHPH